MQFCFLYLFVIKLRGQIVHIYLDNILFLLKIIFIWWHLFLYLKIFFYVDNFEC